MFLEISQNSQENTCARVSGKKETLAQVFSCEFCEISKNNFFTEHLWKTASPLTGKKVKPSNNSAICDHLLHCNFLPSFDNFSVLAYENKKYLLEIKESLLIMRDKPSLNRNINSAPLYLFDKVS